MKPIRQAAKEDAQRIAEIEVFNYRLYFYPIFQNDAFYFRQLTVESLAAKYETCISRFWVYDDGAVKGFVKLHGKEIQKLFVEPALQNRSIGSVLLGYAVETHQANHLWALEKNKNAIRFYQRHGFRVTDKQKFEEDTTERLIMLEK